MGLGYIYGVFIFSHGRGMGEVGITGYATTQEAILHFSEDSTCTRRARMDTCGLGQNGTRYSESYGVDGKMNGHRDGGA